MKQSCWVAILFRYIHILPGHITDFFTKIPVGCVCDHRLHNLERHCRMAGSKQHNWEAEKSWKGAAQSALNNSSFKIYTAPGDFSLYA